MVLKFLLITFKDQSYNILVPQKNLPRKSVSCESEFLNRSEYKIVDQQNARRRCESCNVGLLHACEFFSYPP